jgi:hypothetical protein
LRRNEMVTHLRIFILFLNTTLFYNFILPVNKYLAINRGEFRCIAFRLLLRGNMKLHALLGHPVSFLCIQEHLFHLPWLKHVYIWSVFNEMVTHLRIFILFLNTTLFYNFILPVNKYLAINRGVWLITNNRIAYS